MLAAAPVASGDPVFAGGPTLGPLQRMLSERPHRIDPPDAMRAVAVGMAPCPPRQCLLVRNEGTGRLDTGGGPIEVRLSGYGLIDPASGLVVRGRDTIMLENPARPGEPALSMTVDNVTALR
jgi:hypothetical protein